MVHELRSPGIYLPAEYLQSIATEADAVPGCTVVISHEDVYGSPADWDSFVSKLRTLSAPAVILAVSKLNTLMFQSNYSSLDVQRNIVRNVVDPPMRERVLKVLAEPDRIAFSEEQLLGLVKASILEASPTGSLDVSDRWAEVVQLAFAVSELMTEEQTPTADDGLTDEEEFLPFTIRSLYFNRFEAPAALLARYSDLLFFRPYEPQHVNSANWLDLRNIFKQATGMDPLQYLAVGAGVLAHFLRFRSARDLADVKYQLHVDVLRPAFDEGVPERFIASVARTIPELKTEYDQMPPVPRLAGASHMPLFSFPLVALPSGEVVPASLSRFVDALSIGMYWKIHGYLSGSNQADFLKFTRFVGELFQDHVHEALSASIPDSPLLTRRVFGEIEYDHNQLGADVTLVYDNAVVFLEVSSSRLGYVHAVLGGDVEAIDRDIEKCIIGKARQLDRVIKDFRNDRFDLDGLTGRGVEKVYPVVVLLEHFPLFIFTTQRIERKLKEEGLLLDTEPLRVISIEEIERLEPLLAAGESFRDILVRWTNSQTHSYQSLKNFIIAAYPQAQPSSDRLRRHYSRFTEAIRDQLAEEPASNSPT